MNPVPAPLLLTGHDLVLREWSDEDLAVMSELFDDPDIAHWTPLESPFDLTAARRYLDRARQARRDGERIQLAITTDGRQALGEVLLSPVTGVLGYGVGPAHRGQRLATRALRVMTEYAHQELGLPRLTLKIEADNHASTGVARSAGFRLTDAAPETVTDKGRDCHLLTWEHRATAGPVGGPTGAAPGFPRVCGTARRPGPGH